MTQTEYQQNPGMRFRVKGLNIKAEGKRRWYGYTFFGYYRHTLHKHKARELSATPLICLNVGLLRFKLCDFSRLFPFGCHNPFAIIPRLYNSVWQMLNKSVFSYNHWEMCCSVPPSVYSALFVRFFISRAWPFNKRLLSSFQPANQKRKAFPYPTSQK